MAGKQISDDALASNLAGMSKSQLYDIMSQMKSLIEQNQQQARQILIQNPLLTRALFQAQIMLGMVQAPHAVPSTQPQAPHKPIHPAQQTNVHVGHSTPSKASLQDQSIVSQQVPVRKQQQNQPLVPMSSMPTQGFRPQPVPSQPVEQPRVHMNTQTTQMGHLPSSQVANIPSLPLHSGPQRPSVRQPPMPPKLGRSSVETTGVSHHLLQHPLPPQSRPPMHVQYQPPMGPNVNFQNAGIHQMPHSQPMYHPSSRPPSGMGPSFPQGQPTLPNQPPHQPLFQGTGSHLGPDFSSQSDSTMQMERSTPWPPVSRDNAAGMHYPGPLPLGPGQMPSSNQPNPPPLTREAEQQLLQQVMSLTPEQINSLPPEQRNQLLQLQQMLRQ